MVETIHVTELEGYQEFINQLVETGLQTGKAPWVCDAYIHEEVARQLGKHGIVKRELSPMEEEASRND